MDRVRPGLLRRSDDLVAHEIAFGGGRGADMHRLVGLPHMQRPGVGVRIDRDRGHAHGARGADDAAGNLAAIGDKELLDHGAAANPFPGSLRELGAAICRPECRLNSRSHRGLHRIQTAGGYQPATGLKSWRDQMIGSCGGAGRFQIASKKAANICHTFSSPFTRVRVSHASCPRSRTLRPIAP